MFADIFVSISLVCWELSDKHITKAFRSTTKEIEKLLSEIEGGKNVKFRAALFRLKHHVKWFADCLRTLAYLGALRHSLKQKPALEKVF